jgi:hypothetical protein
MTNLLDVLADNAHTPGIPELPDLDEGQGRAKEDAALATAGATTNVHELPPASKPEGEQRADEDLENSIEAAREELKAKNRKPPVSSTCSSPCCTTRGTTSRR